MAHGQAIHRFMISSTVLVEESINFRPIHITVEQAGSQKRSRG